MERTARGSSEVFSTAFDNPRGLEFGPDGYLYVAEGGRGGRQATSEADCTQVPGPIGPYSGAMTARISRVAPNGVRQTLLDDLPSSQTSPRAGGQVSGVADVAFLGDTLYALISGAGCSHGLLGTENGVYRIADGKAELFADLGAYRSTSEVAEADPEDNEYEGNWWSLVAADGALYALEPNNGEIVRVDGEGKVTRVVDISATQGHIVPTAMAYRDGTFYVGNLGRMPLTPKSSKILRITPDGEVSVYATGLTAVLGLDFAPDGRLFALEATTTSLAPGQSTGRLGRVSEGRPLGVVTAGLMQATGLTFGPDSAAYVSTYGIGPAGAGRVERVLP